MYVPRPELKKLGLVFLLTTLPDLVTLQAPVDPSLRDREYSGEGTTWFTAEPTDAIKPLARQAFHQENIR